MSIWTAQLLYSIPLIAVVSLVYGATRHEYLAEIMAHVFRAMVWIVVFMAVIFGLVVWLSWGL